MFCHLSFAAAVLAMVWALHWGMSHSLGRAPPSWSPVANGLLLLQFPVGHSLLLTRRGSGVLRRLAPDGLGARLSTTTYATIASVQTLALFLFWTPSGVVWWRAEGVALSAICVLHAAAWLFLLRAIFDAGAGPQLGFTGWRSVVTGRPPAYPPMPRHGLFHLCRQPIYLGFALVLWTVPTWTPDQLALALGLSAYCFFGPLLKEARFKARYGADFEAYRHVTPYWPSATRRVRTQAAHDPAALIGATADRKS